MPSFSASAAPPLKVLVVAGARPNFIKVAPLLHALKSQGHLGTLVHTGQHYDFSMSDAFFADLQIPPPDFHLDVGSASHAEQTARIMQRFEPVLCSVKPDWVVVVGDVNSTLACALVAAKLRTEIGCRIAHVEAGLRSGDWAMPEEVNRVLTDRLSDLLLTPSRDAHANLAAEGIPESRVHFVGNVMIDSLLSCLPRARTIDMQSRLRLPEGLYAVATLHRPSNVDDRAIFAEILHGLGDLAAHGVAVVLPLHPRTKARIKEFALQSAIEPLLCIEPLGYLDMVALVDGASLVLTDSGGLQEETTALGVPCITLRQQTERPVTVSHGTNRLIPWPPTSATIAQQGRAAAVSPTDRSSASRPEGWDGHAAERIVIAMADQR